MTKVLEERVSTSFNLADLTLILHLLAAADIGDAERLKLLRQHPRGKAMVKRFQGLLSKAKARAPRKRVHEHYSATAQSRAIMAEIREARGSDRRMRNGLRAELAARYGVPAKNIDRLVRVVGMQDIQYADAAE